MIVHLYAVSHMASQQKVSLSRGPAFSPTGMSNLQRSVTTRLEKVGGRVCQVARDLKHNFRRVVLSSSSAVDMP